MALSVVTGVPETGFRHLIIEEIEEALRADREVVWLLPNRSAVHVAALDVLKIAPVGVKVTTLDSYFEELWELFGDGKQLIGNVARSTLIAEVLEDHTWEHLQEPYTKSGMLNVLASLASIVADPRSLPAKTHAQKEIKALLIEYVDRLRKTPTCERGEAYRRLNSSGANSKVLILSGFPRFSRAARQLILSLANNNQVSCYLEWEEEFAPTRCCDDTIEALVAFPGAAHIHLEPAVAEGEIAKLARSIWADEPDVAKTGAVTFAEAAGDSVEPVLVAELTQALLVEGYERGDIAIVSPRLADSYQAFSEALEQRGIDAHVDVALPFQATPFGRAFMALFKLATAQGSRSDAIAFLRSPYSQVDPEKVYALDERFRKRRTNAPELLMSETIGLGGAVAWLFKDARAAERQPVGAEWARGWEKVGSELLVASGRANGARTIDPLDAAAHTALIQALSDGADVGPSLAKDMFFTALKGARVITGEKEPGADVVLLTEPKRVRGGSYAAIIFSGLTSHEFRTGGDQPTVMRLTEDFGIDDAADIMTSQRNLFYSVISSATERLVLCRKTKNLRGEDVSPSAFIEDVKTAYRGAAGPCALNPDLPVEELQRILPDTQVLGYSQIERVAGGYSTERMQLKRDLLSGKSNVPPLVHGAASDAVKEALEGIDTFSITEIEMYLSCPYRWFFSRQLKAHEIDVEFGARERGTAGHEILELFYTRARQELPEGRPTEKNLPEALALLGEVFAEAQQEWTKKAQTPLESIGFESLRKQIREVIEKDALLPAELAPMELEWGFGLGEDAPAVEVGGVKLKGKIDRIDVAGKKAVLFDYKSGAVYSLNDLHKKQLIQAAVYARAVEEVLGLEVVGSFYRSIRTQGLGGFEKEGALSKPILGPKGRLDAALWDENIAQFVSLLQGAVRGIQAGEIRPRPHDKMSCTYCDAKDVCEVSLL